MYMLIKSIFLSIFSLSALAVADTDSLAMPALDSVIVPTPGAEVKWDTVEISKDYWSEAACMGDLDGDQYLDVFTGSTWIPGKGIQSGTPEIKILTQLPGKGNNPWLSSTAIVQHEYVKQAAYDCRIFDIDGDGHQDLYYTGFPNEEAYWYKNPGANHETATWNRYVISDNVRNESPGVADIDGDGVKDLYGRNTSNNFAWWKVRQGNETAKWQENSTSIGSLQSNTTFEHGMGAGDVNNDGKMDILAPNGIYYQGSGGSFTRINLGNKLGRLLWTTAGGQVTGGGAQMHVADVDGDGDGDIITGLDAHGYGLVLLENRNTATSKIVFKEHLIMAGGPGSTEDGRGILDRVQVDGENFSIITMHATEVGDINNDGTPDIITGHRRGTHPKATPPGDDYKLFWIEIQADNGNFTFTPHRIYTDNGPGTGFQVADFEGDGDLDVVISSKGGIHVMIQRGVPTKKAVERDTSITDPTTNVLDVDLQAQLSATQFVVSQGENQKVLNLGKGATSNIVAIHSLDGAVVKSFTLTQAQKSLGKVNLDVSDLSVGSYHWSFK